MKQWTRIIALKKKKAAINFMTILNPTYWPLIGDKAKQFHIGDTIKLSIPSSFGPDESGGGNIPEDIVKLRKNKNGTNGKIISIDQVEGIPGSDAEAMTIQLDSGERLDKFPAAWVVKASKTFKIKKAKSEKEAEYDNGYDYGDEVSGLDEKDAKDAIQHIKDDYKKGRISKSYYKGFIDGYNDSASYNFGPDQDDEFIPIK